MWPAALCPPSEPGDGGGDVRSVLQVKGTVARPYGAETVAPPSPPRSIAAMPDSTRGTFADVLAGATAALRPLCEHLRATIRELHPQCVEVVWPRQKIASFGVGPKKMTEHYCYLQVHAAHINLGFYRGAELRDPQRMLDGTGKALRHVKLTDVAAARRAPVVALLRAAIAERQRAMGS